MTRTLPGGWIVDDIHPIRDGISEADACKAFGGSRDIHTDVYLSSILSTSIHSEDAHKIDEAVELGRTCAIPSSSRRSAIDRYRIQIAATANESLLKCTDPPGERHTSVSFATHQVVIDLDDSDSKVHGRMHVEPFEFTHSFDVPDLASTIGQRLSCINVRRRGSHSEHNFGNDAQSSYLSLNRLVLDYSPPSRVRFSKYLEGESRTACIYRAREPVREPERDQQTTAHTRCRLMSKYCSAPVVALLRCVC